jgi:hypothetical protein
MTTVQETLMDGQKPAEKQVEEVRKAAQRPVVYTDETPKLTPEELAEFRKANANGREMCTLCVPI